LRDYGQDTQTIWDGDPKCEHEWGKEITRKQSGGTRISSVTNNSDERIHFVSKSNFCSKCGGWKGQLGLEPTLNLYIKHLCEIFDEVKRVLKKIGTCWVNLGDTYSTHGGSKGSKYAHNFRSAEESVEQGIYQPKPSNSLQGLPEKSLCQIPSRFAIEMCNRGWVLRNELIWHKPNCMPSSTKDRFTADFEKIFFFVKSKKYYFEMQYEPHTDDWYSRAITWRNGNAKQQQRGKSYHQFGEVKPFQNPPNPLGRNKRCVWKIPTQPFPDAHFAVYPEALIETPIKAGCPEFICEKCGEPRKKMYASGERIETGGTREKDTPSIGNKDIPTGYILKIERGYSDCGCKAGFKPGIVLDPFCGSGTTCVVAKRIGRRWIGIDINRDYCEMARKRVAQVKGRL
jgi:site-specific DNA-methyltransferase (adenine-specific)